jgi:hypothetical protein
MARCLVSSVMAIVIVSAPEFDGSYVEEEASLSLSHSALAKLCVQ